MTQIEQIEKIPHDALMQMSPEAWRTAAWDAAVEGIVTGVSRVVRTVRGYWHINCDSLKTMQSLQGRGEIVARLHQMHEIRILPPLRAIITIPPDDFVSPFSLVHRKNILNMPPEIWHAYAFKLSVDSETAETISIIGISNGIWQVRCDSVHAYQFLQTPQTVIGMIYWLSRRFRPLPPMSQISLMLGKIQMSQPATECGIQPDDADIPVSVTDPELRRILARLKPSGTRTS